MFLLYLYVQVRGYTVAAVCYRGDQSTNKLEYQSFSLYSILLQDTLYNFNIHI